MASYTENILLTLRAPEDIVEVESFNRDNEILDKLLAPVSVDYAVLSSAARINSYNVMKAIRAAHYAGTETAEKTAMFFGDFDSAAYSTSDRALLMAEKHGYVFSDYAGDYFPLGAAGDVPTPAEISDSTFSFTAPVSGYINAYEFDAMATTYDRSDTACRLIRFNVGGVDYGYLDSVNVPFTRTVVTAQLDEPIPVHKGDVITGAMMTTSSYMDASIYSAELGVPYIRFHITPAMDSGWVQTELNALGSMGHSEARVYIQCLKDEKGTIGTSLIDEVGNELELTKDGSRTTVTKDGSTCIELCFTAPFSKEAAALKISVASNGGYADIYNYAVTVL